MTDWIAAKCDLSNVIDIMRKYYKTRCLDMLMGLEEVHSDISKAMMAKNIDGVPASLEQCQRTAIEIGTAIEESEGEGTEAVRLLEEYCEVVYLAHEELAQGKNFNGKQFEKETRRLLSRVKTEIRDVIPTQYEVVFLPYKASMWDSLESVWKAADEDPNCEAYVIPIPYYDKNPDGSYARLHYEINEFPDYVPTVKYRDYNFAERHPDRIYIHNPYDNRNFVTEVQRDFFSDRLKECTDELVYIPYFVLQEPPDTTSPYYKEYIDNMRHFVLVPGVVNANRIIVQSETMKKAYVGILCESNIGGTRQYWEQKIEGTGSPKYDRILSLKREDIDVPSEWQPYLSKTDGTQKRVILYNTSVGMLLEKDEAMLKKMRIVFETFRKNVDEVALLWRPHPLIEATIASMRPQLWEDYQKLVAWYKKENIGIYDDTADIDRAIVLADAYYGDWSSVVWLCQKVGMPVMIQDVEIREHTDLR